MSNTDIHNARSQPQQSSSANAIELFDDSLDDCHHAIFNRHSSSPTIFDAIVTLVLSDIRDNVFPSFMQSSLFRLYIQCINLHSNPLEPSSKSSSKLTVSDFHTLRVLGRGAFGFVNAVIKKNTGHIYAMKCINKKRVMATDSVDTIMSERNFLSDMDSNFVTGLKYAVQDNVTLYLIIDLMVGGDLKFHLNKEGRFNIERSRFYAAEVLLGLQHIHSKGIIYRDIKLENVLLDNRGHCKISDLGLAVRSTKPVRGYAGTPGYTAPEVCLQQSYGAKADFFSLGVMVYRFLSGRKPFQSKAKKKKEVKKDDKKGHRTGNELDKNVVEIEPEYPDRYFTPSARSILKGLMCKNPVWRLAKIDDIKAHPWFTTKIDFGLLESGNLRPPFIPNQDEINADSLRHIGRPPNDDKYKDVKVTEKFEQSLSAFPFVSGTQQQKEVVDVLKKIREYYSFQNFMSVLENLERSHTQSQPQTASTDVMCRLADIPDREEIDRFAEGVRERRQRMGMDAFIPQWYRRKDDSNGLNGRGDVGIGHAYESGHDRYRLIENHEKEDETETGTAEVGTGGALGALESSVSHSNEVQEVKTMKVTDITRVGGTGGKTANGERERRKEKKRELETYREQERERALRESEMERENEAGAPGNSGQCMGCEIL